MAIEFDGRVREKAGGEKKVLCLRRNNIHIQYWSKVLGQDPFLPLSYVHQHK